MVQEPVAGQVRVALVGCGQIGRLHAQRLAADPRVQLAALCDADIHAARALARLHAPQARVFSQLDEFLGSGTCDAAVLCTPTSRHFDQVRACRAAGLAVLCEKPLADTRDRICRLIDEAGSGPMLSVAFQRRYWSAYRTLKREVESGRHGPVRTVTALVGERWQPTITGTWRDDPQLNPGGFIGDAGSHKIDMVFFVTGLAARDVFAHSDKRGSRVEITTALTARLSGEASLCMTFLGDIHHFLEEFAVHCAQADLLYRDGRLSIARENRVEPLTPLEPESNPDLAFIDCVTGGAPNAAPASVALPVWDFTQAALESARTGLCVAVGSGAGAETPARGARAVQAPSGGQPATMPTHPKP